jgi:hypothetical protein
MITLERVRKAISEGTIPVLSDTEVLALELPVELQFGLARLIAGVVATYHSNGGASVSDWMGESVEDHIGHAFRHAEEAYDSSRHNSVGPDSKTEDGLLHLDHAACRIAMAFAREMMVSGKGDV